MLHSITHESIHDLVRVSLNLVNWLILLYLPHSTQYVNFPFGKTLNVMTKILITCHISTS